MIDIFKKSNVELVEAVDVTRKNDLLIILNVSVCAVMHVLVSALERSPLLFVSKNTMYENDSLLFSL